MEEFVESTLWYLILSSSPGATEKKGVRTAASNKSHYLARVLHTCGIIEL